MKTPSLTFSLSHFHTFFELLANSRSFSINTVTAAVFFLYACGTDRHDERPDTEFKEIREPLIDANKIRIQKEALEIEKYIKRNQLNMEETGTGLRYFIYHKGEGEKATKGKTAVINFKISLLNGTVCYYSESNLPKKFLIGQGGVESGLEEGILLLKVGDKAKFILPSHLAYGLLGDGNKIPSHAAIIYDVELTKLQ